MKKVNTKKFAIAAVGAFAFIFVFEMVWHAFLMKGMYAATASVWRPEGEGQMLYLFLAQILLALALVFFYSKFGKKLSSKNGMTFGFCAGLVLAAPQLGSYCYLPIPITITFMWMLASVLECTGAGMIISKLYKS